MNMTDTDDDVRYFNPLGDDPSEDDYHISDGPSEDDHMRDEYTAQSFSLFDAPDYAQFIRHQQTSRGAEYQKKVESMLKAAALTCFRNGDAVDGATILHYGPSFAHKAGDLTDVSDNARRAIDMLTAPDNPWVMFAIAALPFGMQLFRNHEAEASAAAKQVKQTRAEKREYKRRVRTGELPPPPPRKVKGITIHGPFGRKFTVRIPVPRPAVLINLLRSQTHEPAELATKVLSDPKLQKALAKQGIIIEVRQTNGT
jgi:hypothetical protein